MRAIAACFDRKIKECMRIHRIGKNPRPGVRYVEYKNEIVPVDLMRHFDIDYAMAGRLRREIYADCGYKTITKERFLWWQLHVEELG